MGAAIEYDIYTHMTTILNLHGLELRVTSNRVKGVRVDIKTRPF